MGKKRGATSRKSYTFPESNDVNAIKIWDLKSQDNLEKDSLDVQLSTLLANFIVCAEALHEKKYKASFLRENKKTIDDLCNSFSSLNTLACEEILDNNNFQNCGYLLASISGVLSGIKDNLKSFAVSEKNNVSVTVKKTILLTKKTFNKRVGSRDEYKNYINLKNSNNFIAGRLHSLIKSSKDNVKKNSFNEGLKDVILLTRAIDSAENNLLNSGGAEDMRDICAASTYLLLAKDIVENFYDNFQKSAIDISGNDIGTDFFNKVNTLKDSVRVLNIGVEDYFRKNNENDYYKIFTQARHNFSSVLPITSALYKASASGQKISATNLKNLYDNIDNFTKHFSEKENEEFYRQNSFMVEEAVFLLEELLIPSLKLNVTGRGVAFDGRNKGSEDMELTTEDERSVAFIREKIQNSLLQIKQQYNVAGKGAENTRDIFSAAGRFEDDFVVVEHNIFNKDSFRDACGFFVNFSQIQDILKKDSKCFDRKDFRENILNACGNFNDMHLKNTNFFTLFPKCFVDYQLNCLKETSDLIDQALHNDTEDKMLIFSAEDQKLFNNFRDNIIDAQQRQDFLLESKSVNDLESFAFFVCDYIKNLDEFMRLDDNAMLELDIKNFFILLDDSLSHLRILYDKDENILPMREVSRALSGFANKHNHRFTKSISLDLDTSIRYLSQFDNNFLGRQKGADWALVDGVENDRNTDVEKININKEDGLAGKVSIAEHDNFLDGGLGLSYGALGASNEGIKSGELAPGMESLENITETRYDASENVNKDESFFLRKGEKESGSLSVDVSDAKQVFAANKRDELLPDLPKVKVNISDKLVRRAFMGAQYISSARENSFVAPFASLDGSAVDDVNVSDNFNEADLRDNHADIVMPETTAVENIMDSAIDESLGGAELLEPVKAYSDANIKLARQIEMGGVVAKKDRLEKPDVTAANEAIIEKYLPSGKGVVRFEDLGGSAVKNVNSLNEDNRSSEQKSLMKAVDGFDIRKKNDALLHSVLLKPAVNVINSGVFNFGADREFGKKSFNVAENIKKTRPDIIKAKKIPPEVPVRKSSLQQGVDENSVHVQPSQKAPAKSQERFISSAEVDINPQKDAIGAERGDEHEDADKEIDGLSQGAGVGGDKEIDGLGQGTEDAFENSVYMQPSQKAPAKSQERFISSAEVDINPQKDAIGAERGDEHEDADKEIDGLSQGAGVGGDKEIDGLGQGTEDAFENSVYMQPSQKAPAKSQERFISSAEVDINPQKDDIGAERGDEHEDGDKEIDGLGQGAGVAFENSVRVQPFKEKPNVYDGGPDSSGEVLSDSGKSGLSHEDSDKAVDSLSHEDIIAVPRSYTARYPETHQTHLTSFLPSQMAPAKSQERFISSAEVGGDKEIDGLSQGAGVFVDPQKDDIGEERGDEHEDVDREIDSLSQGTEAAFENSVHVQSSQSQERLTSRAEVFVDPLQQAQVESQKRLTSRAEVFVDPQKDDIGGERGDVSEVEDASGFSIDGSSGFWESDQEIDGLYQELKTGPHDKNKKIPPVIPVRKSSLQQGIYENSVRVQLKEKPNIYDSSPDSSGEVLSDSGKSGLSHEDSDEVFRFYAKDGKKDGKDVAEDMGGLQQQSMRDLYLEDNYKLVDGRESIITKDDASVELVGNLKDRDYMVDSGAIDQIDLRDLELEEKINRWRDNADFTDTSISDQWEHEQGDRRDYIQDEDYEERAFSDRRGYEQGDRRGHEQGDRRDYIQDEDYEERAFSDRRGYEQGDRRGHEQGDRRDYIQDEDYEERAFSDRRGYEQGDRRGYEQSDRRDYIQDEDYEERAFSDRRGYEQGDRRGHEQIDRRGYEQGDRRGHEQGDRRGHEQGDRRGHEQGDRRGHEQIDRRGHEQDGNYEEQIFQYNRGFNMLDDTIRARIGKANHEIVLCVDELVHHTKKARATGLFDQIDKKLTDSGRALFFKKQADLREMHLQLFDASVVGDSAEVNNVKRMIDRSVSSMTDLLLENNVGDAFAVALKVDDFIEHGARLEYRIFDIHDSIEGMLNAQNISPINKKSIFFWGGPVNGFVPGQYLHNFSGSFSIKVPANSHLAIRYLAELEDPVLKQAIYSKELKEFTAVTRRDDLAQDVDLLSVNTVRAAAENRAVNATREYQNLERLFFLEKEKSRNIESNIENAQYNVDRLSAIKDDLENKLQDAHDKLLDNEVLINDLARELDYRGKVIEDKLVTLDSIGSKYEKAITEKAELEGKLNFSVIELEKLRGDENVTSRKNKVILKDLQEKIDLLEGQIKEKNLQIAEQKKEFEVEAASLEVAKQEKTLINDRYVNSGGVFQDVVQEMEGALARLKDVDREVLVDKKKDEPVVDLSLGKPEEVKTDKLLQELLDQFKEVVVASKEASKKFEEIISADVRGEARDGKSVSFNEKDEIINKEYLKEELPEKELSAEALVSETSLSDKAAKVPVMSFEAASTKATEAPAAPMRLVAGNIQLVLDPVHEGMVFVQNSPANAIDKAIGVRPVVQDSKIEELISSIEKLTSGEFVRVVDSVPEQQDVIEQKEIVRSAGDRDVKIVGAAVVEKVQKEADVSVAKIAAEQSLMPEAEVVGLAEGRGKIDYMPAIQLEKRMQVLESQLGDVKNLLVKQVQTINSDQAQSVSMAKPLVVEAGISAENSVGSEKEFEVGFEKETLDVSEKDSAEAEKEFEVGPEKETLDVPEKDSAEVEKEFEVGPEKETSDVSKKDSAEVEKEFEVGPEKETLDVPEKDSAEVEKEFEVGPEKETLDVPEKDSAEAEKEFEVGPEKETLDVPEKDSAEVEKEFEVGPEKETLDVPEKDSAEAEKEFEVGPEKETLDVSKKDSAEAVKEAKVDDKETMVDSIIKKRLAYVLDSIADQGPSAGINKVSEDNIGADWRVAEATDFDAKVNKKGDGIELKSKIKNDMLFYLDDIAEQCSVDNVMFADKYGAISYSDSKGYTLERGAVKIFVGYPKDQEDQHVVELLIKDGKAIKFADPNQVYDLQELVDAVIDINFNGIPLSKYITDGLIVKSVGEPAKANLKIGSVAGTVGKLKSQQKATEDKDQNKTPEVNLKNILDAAQDKGSDVVDSKTEVDYEAVAKVMKDLKMDTKKKFASEFDDEKEIVDKEIIDSKPEPEKAENETEPEKAENEPEPEKAENEPEPEKAENELILEDALESEKQSTVANEQKAPAKKEKKENNIEEEVISEELDNVLDKIKNEKKEVGAKKAEEPKDISDDLDMDFNLEEELDVELDGVDKGDKDVNTTKDIDEVSLDSGIESDIFEEDILSLENEIEDQEEKDFSKVELDGVSEAKKDDSFGVASKKEKARQQNKQAIEPGL